MIDKDGRRPISMRPENLKEHVDLWESKALDANTEWVSLAGRGDNDVNYDDKPYTFTAEDLEILELGKEELVRRNLHRHTYHQAQLYVLDGRIGQDDADLFFDVWNADPTNLTLQWYNRVGGLNNLRERFDE